MAHVLLVTDRMNSEIDRPEYTTDQEAGNGATHVSYDTESFTLNAKKGVTYSINGSGDSHLLVTISGPGLQPITTTLGQVAQFTAPAQGVYKIKVASPEVDTARMPGDHPYFGAFYLEVYTNVADDVGLVMPPSNVFNPPKKFATYAESIDVPTYELDAAGKPKALKTFDVDTFTIKAEKGDFYGFETTGAAGLKVTVTGPGFFYEMDDGSIFEAPLDGKIGDPLGFQATVGGIYTITVESDTAATAVGAEDRPHSGAYTIDVKKTEGEDIDRVNAGEVFTANTERKGRIGTASDADQIYGSLPAGASMFLAVSSKDVKDITIEVLEDRNERPLKAVTAADGFAVLTFTSPAADMYEMLIRSGSYYQEGDYVTIGGQRLAPSNTLSVGRPEGSTLAYGDSVNREVWGWSGDTNITTGGGHDVLVATMSGNDRLLSGAGDDEIYLGGGTDYADGGAGRDVAYFPGVKAFASIGKTAAGDLVLSGTVIVSNKPPLSTFATLKDIEFVEFMDGVYEVAHERFLPGIVHFDKPGNETIKGGKSIEGAIYNGDRDQFSVTLTAEGATVVDRDGNGGVNKLTSVEKLLFDDLTTQIDFAGADGKMGSFNEMGTAGRAAIAALTVWGPSGLADKVLVGQVIDFFSEGAEAEDAAFLLWASGLLQDAVGSDTDAATVDYLYKNVAGVAPTPDAHAEIMRMFDDPEFSQIKLLEFAFDHPVQQDRLSDLGYLDHGVDYIAVPPLEFPE